VWVPEPFFRFYFDIPHMSTGKIKACMRENVPRCKIMKWNNLEVKKGKVIQNAHGSCHQKVSKQALPAHIQILMTILAPPEFSMYYFH